MSGNFVPLCTAERCKEISQGYAFFCVPLEQCIQRKPHPERVRAFLAPFQGADVGDGMATRGCAALNPWLISLSQPSQPSQPTKGANI